MYRFEKANERVASGICLREFVFCANVNYIFSWNKQWNKPHYRLVFNIIKSSICVRKWLIYIFGPNYSFVLATCVLLHRYLFSFFLSSKISSFSSLAPLGYTIEFGVCFGNSTIHNLFWTIFSSPKLRCFCNMACVCANTNAHICTCSRSFKSTTDIQSNLNKLNFVLIFSFNR